MSGGVLQPASHSVGRRAGAVALVVLLPALLTAGCDSHTPESVLELMRNSGRVVDGIDTAGGNGNQLEELNDTAHSLGAVDRAAIAQKDLGRLASLEASLDAKLAALAASVSYTEALEAQKLAGSEGRALAERSVDTATTKATFVDDLTEVSTEAIKGLACDALRKDALSSGDDSSEPAGDEAGWQGDVAHAAQVLLAKAWNASKVEAFLDWEEWAKRVAESADDVSKAAANDPDLLLRYAAQPSARMVAVEYAKFCHGFPMPP